MLVTRLDVPQGTRLAFQPNNGPLTHLDDFYDLGLVVIAEQHADEDPNFPDQMTDSRMVLECEGVEASELSKQLKWPQGETILPGTVRYGTLTYPAGLQIRARPNGLRAILRSR